MSKMEEAIPPVQHANMHKMHVFMSIQHLPCVGTSDIIYIVDPNQ